MRPGAPTIAGRDWLVVHISAWTACAMGILPAAAETNLAEHDNPTDTPEVWHGPNGRGQDRPCLAGQDSALVRIAGADPD